MVSQHKNNSCNVNNLLAKKIKNTISPNNINLSTTFNQTAKASVDKASV